MEHVFALLSRVDHEGDQLYGIFKTIEGAKGEVERLKKGEEGSYNYYKNIDLDSWTKNDDGNWVIFAIPGYDGDIFVIEKCEVFE